MSKDETYNMIGKKLANELSELENEQFEKWLADKKPNQESYEMLKKGWEVEFSRQGQEQGDRLFGKIMSELEDEDFPQLGQPKSSRLSAFIKYAAVFAVLIMASFIIWDFDYDSKFEPNKITLVNKTNAFGQKSTFHLSDGSKVFLNAGSTLTYPSKFEGDHREISLIGEAYFEVVKDAKRPFTVNVGKVKVLALGTSFNINSRSEKIEVALTEGKVKVSLPDESKQMTLIPGELSTINLRKSLFSKSNFSMKKVTAWKDGTLIFIDASMDEAIEKLELWYGINIQTESFHSHTWSYNGEFKDKSLSQVLMSMSLIQDFKYEIKDRNVIFRNK